MAEAFFNRLAAARGLAITAASAGTVPGPAVNPVVVQAMAELDIDMDGHYPKHITPELVGTSRRIITMGCGVDTNLCPIGTRIDEDWALPDPHGQSLDAVRPVRDAVRERVQHLVEELATGA